MMRGKNRFWQVGAVVVVAVLFVFAIANGQVQPGQAAIAKAARDMTSQVDAILK